ncbi:hypothetical protein ELI45_10750 [Rhizobium ruizarguesonis]|nr:hypothetical protein ELI45_10750 [Rhizobium ruizarguesonis]
MNIMQGSTDRFPEPAFEGTAEEMLHLAKHELLKLREKQSEYFLRAAKAVETLKAKLPDSDRFNIATWLQKDVGFSASEAKSYVKFDAELSANSQLLQGKRVSPDAIRALIASDSKTRSECLVRIERDDQVDARVIEKARRSNRRAVADLAIQRRNLFQTAAVRVGFAVKDSLEAGAQSLLTLMNELTSDPVLKEADRRAQAHPTETEQLLRAKEALASKASEVVRDFETLFGSTFPDRGNTSDILARGEMGASIVNAWHALKDLEAGNFAPFDVYETNRRPTSHRSCVQFIAGSRATASRIVQIAAYPEQMPYKPTFIDIDAGVGGTALGLEAAGFHAVALLAENFHVRNALKSNRSRWKLHELTREGFADTLSGALSSVRKNFGKIDIDVVTGGLPWHYHRNPERAATAFENAITAVDRIRPRAFFFEGAPADVGRQRIARPFQDMGYDVKWHSIDADRYGVAQAKTYKILVGARNDLLKDLVIPVVNPPLRNSFADAIGDLVEERGRVHAAGSANRFRFDNAISSRRALCGDRRAPLFENPDGSRNIAEWLNDFRIDIRGYTNRPPTLNELENMDGFRLSTAMLKRIQGFPDLWNVEDGSSTNSWEVAGAVSPIVAKVMGIAILEAVTGVEFEHRALFQGRLLSPIPATVIDDEGVERKEYQSPDRALVSTLRKHSIRFVGNEP